MSYICNIWNRMGNPWFKYQSQKLINDTSYFYYGFTTTFPIDEDFNIAILSSLNESVFIILNALYLIDTKLFFIRETDCMDRINMTLIRNKIKCLIVDEGYFKKIQSIITDNLLLKNIIIIGDIKYSIQYKNIVSYNSIIKNGSLRDIKIPITKINTNQPCFQVSFGKNTNSITHKQLEYSISLFIQFYKTLVKKDTFVFLNIEFNPIIYSIYSICLIYNIPFKITNSIDKYKSNYCYITSTDNISIIKSGTILCYGTSISSIELKKLRRNYKIKEIFYLIDIFENSLILNIYDYIRNKCLFDVNECDNYKHDLVKITNSVYTSQLLFKKYHNSYQLLCESRYLLYSENNGYYLDYRIIENYIKNLEFVKDCKIELSGDSNKEYQRPILWLSVLSSYSNPLV